MLFGLNIMPFNIRIQGQQRVCKSGKAKNIVSIKVLLISATMKVLLTGATMTIEKVANSGQSLMKMKFL